MISKQLFHGSDMENDVMTRILKNKSSLKIHKEWTDWKNVSIRKSERFLSIH